MAFGSVQYGKETEAGSAVAATQHVENFGSAAWGNDPEFDQPQLLSSSYARFASGSKKREMGMLSLTEGRLSYEMAPWFLSQCLKVPAISGSGPYTYLFDPSLTTNDAINTATYEAQNDVLEREMAFGFVQSFGFGVDGPREHTDFAVEVRGRPWADTTITPALAHVATEHVAGNRWALWLDDTGGTIGTTAYAGCLKAFRFESGELRTPYECLAASTNFTGVAHPTWAPTLMLRVAVDATSADLLTTADAGTRQLVRLKATSATTTSTFQLDMAARIMSVSRVGATIDQEQWILEFNLVAELDATWGKLFVFTILNQEAALRV
jgi:hypothetical protein